MEIEKKNPTSGAETETEEVVFSTGRSSEASKPAYPEKKASVCLGGSPVSTSDGSGSDGVVFAETGRSTVQRHAAKQIKKKSTLFSVPVIFGSLLLLSVAVSGIVFAVSYNNNSAPAMVLTDSQLVSDDDSSDAESSEEQSKEESKEESLPVIRTPEAEIKEIGTQSIVFGDNVTVSGIKLGGKTLSEAYDAMQDRLLELRDKISISINCDGKNITLTEDDFKFDTDVSDVLVQAYHFSRGELDEPTVFTAYNDGKTDFKVTSVINSDSIKNAVSKVSDKFDIQPVDAHVSKFEPTATEKFTYEDGSDGYLIDQKLVRNKIDEILLQTSKMGSFDIETVRTPYKRTIEDIKANTKLISSSCTTAANVWASNFNMELAIKSANGTVVQPGETFSFNTMTGNTTNGDLGYVKSTAIVNGKYEQQYGGGICQASTTIYLAAVKADMTIEERHAHQYPSSYADRGLDATVDYGNLDMRFTNDKDYPIYIATYVYDYYGNGMDELMVEFYGPISDEYDEIVPVGWVTYAGSENYSARGAKVYFKDGKEVKRQNLPIGSYDYHYDTYYSVQDLIPSDVEYGPKNVSATGKTPTVYSPGGCGSNAPVKYGTAAEVLAEAKNARNKTEKKTSKTESEAEDSADTSANGEEDEEIIEVSELSETPETVE